MSTLPPKPHSKPRFLRHSMQSESSMSKPEQKVLAKIGSLRVEPTRNSTPMGPNTERDVKAQIDAELGRVEKPPPSDLASLLAPLLEPIIQAAEVMKLLQQRWTAWIEENREWLTQIRAALNEAGTKVGGFVVDVSQASAQFAETLDEVERLASIGWTLPTQLSLPDLIEFLALPDADSAADYLIRKLEVSDPEFVHMEERLRRDPLLREFPTSLSQCFRAIRRGDYAIAVPSLVAMLERVIQQLNPPEYHATPTYLRLFGRME
jgi:hypothetical protein